MISATPSEIFESCLGEFKLLNDEKLALLFDFVDNNMSRQEFYRHLNEVAIAMRLEFAPKPAKTELEEAVDEMLAARPTPVRSPIPPPSKAKASVPPPAVAAPAAAPVQVASTNAVDLSFPVHKHEKHIVLDKQLIEDLNSLMEDDATTIKGIEPGEPLWLELVELPKLCNKTMVVMLSVRNGAPHPYGEAVLIQDTTRLKTLPTFFRLEGSFAFEYAGAEYVVNVRQAEA